MGRSCACNAITGRRREGISNKEEEGGVKSAPNYSEISEDDTTWGGGSFRNSENTGIFQRWFGFHVGDYYAIEREKVPLRASSFSHFGGISFLVPPYIHLVVPLLPNFGYLPSSPLPLVISLRKKT